MSAREYTAEVVDKYFNIQYLLFEKKCVWYTLAFHLSSIFIYTSNLALQSHANGRPHNILL